MIYNKVNMVIDGLWGSCGKGLMAGYLAEKHDVTVASTNNLPNAGHTVILKDGSKFISKVIPVTSFLNTVGKKAKILIGPGGGFSIDRLFQEMAECGLSEDDILIHPRAMVVTEEHASVERGEAKTGSTKHIASTMQGSGAARAEKIMRGADVKLARDYETLMSMIAFDWIDQVKDFMFEKEALWLHEGSQGFSLGVNHGSHYPQCTSRDCSTSRELSDLGVAPQKIGDVYLVLRPFPIRVGHVVEEGTVAGHSGDCYHDQREMTWEELKEQSGYPKDFDLCELTTVTKRVRRVFTFSPYQLKQAVEVNGATKLALNFANYLDYSCFQTQGTDRTKLPAKVREFIEMIENLTDVPVSLVGTGAANNHIWDFDI